MHDKNRPSPVKTTYQEWADDLATDPAEEARRADRAMTVFWLAMFVGIAVLTMLGRI